MHRQFELYLRFFFFRKETVRHRRWGSVGDAPEVARDNWNMFIFFEWKWSEKLSAKLSFREKGKAPSKPEATGDHTNACDD